MKRLRKNAPRLTFRKIYIYMANSIKNGCSRGVMVVQCANVGIQGKALHINSIN
jgi:hypothetical protein